MPNLIDIRRRIRSVKNTQQITKAMKMVAAAKLRRAQDQILSTRPYALEIRRVIGNVASRGEDIQHPLLEVREEGRDLLIVVSGDKGLAGSFNANVLRRSSERLGESEGTDLLLLGKKGADFFRRRELPTRASYSSLFSGVKYEDAKAIAKDIVEAFSRREYRAVKVVYNQFKSMLTQELTEEQLLPIQPTQEIDDGGARAYQFEPAPSVVLGELLPRYVTFQIYRILLESQAAEHAARMGAMDAATKNASEMIEKLTLQYNRARQAAITTELIEVVSGANALAG
ncbi:MAG: ATP synthase F1 subunit gamma [Thermoanaerobaculia bacterium]|nr:ATP synthase F1 subunit gamma [Thermoanaerobaculia bacterium]